MHSTAIIGYESRYSKELVSRNGGGLHVESGNFEELGAALVKGDRDRLFLAELVGRARMDGRRFGADEVFRLRSGLIMEAFRLRGPCRLKPATLSRNLFCDLSPIKTTKVDR